MNRSNAELRREFHDTFGAGGKVRVIRAPGRVNLIGEHTDYNDLPVLPMAIQREARIALRPRDDGMVVLHTTEPDPERDADQVRVPLGVGVDGGVGSDFGEVVRTDLGGEDGQAIGTDAEGVLAEVERGVAGRATLHDGNGDVLTLDLDLPGPGPYQVTLRRRADSGDMRAVDVQLNADTLVHLARDPAAGWRGELRLTPTVRDTMYVEGTIEAGRTLFEALVYDDELQVPASER